MSLPNVALIGRTNVGKSTLFNKLTESQEAIVSPVSGTTRDRKIATVNWRDFKFNLIDTGGANIDLNDPLNKEVLKQVDQAAAMSQVIIFVVDGRQGLQPADQKILTKLRKFNTPIILAVNKIDNPRLRNIQADFANLGLEKVQLISSANGSGTGDLLDIIGELLPKGFKEKIPEKFIKVALVGQTNVGKSTLINSLLGEERLIVSNQPHTTRDTQDIFINYQGRTLQLIDTAGLRKKKSKQDQIERLSVEQSLEAIDRADVTLFMIDVTDFNNTQNKRIAQIIKEKHTGLIVVANKWDLIKTKSSQTTYDFERFFHQVFPHLSWAPIIFISALEKQRLTKTLDLVLQIYQERFRMVSDNALSKFLHQLVSLQKPKRGSIGRGILPTKVTQPYIKTFKQDGVNPPKFVLKLNQKAKLSVQYINFIENQLRKKFGFQGTAIQIDYRS